MFSLNGLTSLGGCELTNRFLDEKVRLPAHGSLPDSQKQYQYPKATSLNDAGCSCESNPEDAPGDMTKWLILQNDLRKNFYNVNVDLAGLVGNGGMCRFSGF